MQTGVLAKLQHHLQEPRGQVGLVVILLAVSLFVRLLLSRFIPEWGVDLPLFGYWFDVAAESGLPGFYDVVERCDYPPFNIYIFWLFGKMAHAIGPDTSPFFIKLPGNLFDIATAFLIFRFLRLRFSFKVSLAVMVLYAFNPATIFNLAVWGQMDSVYTFFMIASLYSALRSRYELSGALLSLAILTKPQSIVLLPVLAYIILRNGGWQRALSSSAIFGAVVFLVVLPFNWDNPIAFLFDRYQGYGWYEYNSVNAFNFWAILGLWKPDTVPHLGLTYQVWGILAFVGLVAFVMWQLHRRYEPRAAIFAVFLLAFGFFMLMTRMHERYLFPVFALLALGWSARFSTRFALLIYLGLTATYLVNMAYAFAWISAEPPIFITGGHWSIYVMVPANAVLLALSLWQFYRMRQSKLSQVMAEPLSHPPPAPDDGEAQTKL